MIPESDKERLARVLYKHSFHFYAPETRRRDWNELQPRAHKPYEDRIDTILTELDAAMGYTLSKRIPVEGKVT